MTNTTLDTQSVRRWKRYDEMRDFDAEWLSKVPSHWETRRLSTVCGFQSGKAHEPYVEDGARFVCVNSRFVSTGGATRKYCTENLSPARKNDLLMVMSDLPNGRALAKAFFVEENDVYAVNQRVCIITPEKAQHARFLYYLLDRNPNFLQYDDGFNQTHLSNAVFTKFPLLIPPLAEQRAIAAFLDRETARIDALIEKKERLIALLKEKREAVITHAVTRGLDRTVELRESGLPSIGLVPKHWNVLPLKRRWQVTDCKHRTVEFISEGYPIASIGEVHGFELDLSNASRASELEYLDLIGGGRKPKRGDIVYSRNATVGEAAYVNTDEPFCLGQDVCLITSAAENQRFLVYQLRSSAVMQPLEARMIGSTFKRINVGDIREFAICCPSRPEQDAIAEHCDRISLRVKMSEDRISRGIAHLHEYRTALISAAVTGQIDVREEVTLHD